MAKRSDDLYIPSYAGLFRFKEEKSKIVLSPKALYIISAILAIVVIFLHIYTGI